jgi:DNA-binding MarR family transcriptional regulator
MLMIVKTLPTNKTSPELASRLRSAVARLGRRLRQEGMVNEEASPSQLTALATLFRTGPMTLGELAGAERVKPPTMTRIVAALEERGLVRREPSPDDGRVVHVVLTEDGHRAHEDYRKRRDAWLRSKLSQLSAPERHTLAWAAEILDRLAEDT